MCGPTKAMCQQCKNAFAAKILEADELKTERDRYKEACVALCEAYARAALHPGGAIRWEDIDRAYNIAYAALPPKDLAEIEKQVEAEEG